MQSRVVDPVVAALDDLASNVIGSSEVALEGRHEPGVRTEETNEGNLMADALLWQATQVAADLGVAVPDVGIQNGGGIRNNTLIPAGNITELTTFDIAPFSNFASVTENLDREAFRLTVASVDFLARGGDGYPFFSPFTRVGFSYQQALANYIVNGLSGVISGADNPEGGEGRITELP